jgi:hypothetical protein
MKTFILLCLLAGSAGAERPQAGFRSLDESMSGTPTLRDDMKQRELIEWSRRLDFERFAEPWTSAGCEVEGMGPMDRVICPGFRVNPRIAPVVSEQWPARDFSEFERAKPVKQRKSDIDGKI